MVSFGQTQSISKVINDSTDNKSKIYIKTLIWVAKEWKNSNEVIQLKDEVNGIIIIKGNLSTTNKNGDITKSTITINIKDGKAKITFDNIYLYNPGFIRTYENPTKWYMSWKDDVTKEIYNLILDYEKSLITNSNDF